MRHSVAVRGKCEFNSEGMQMNNERRFLSTRQLKWVPSIGGAMVLLALVSAPLPAAAVTCNLLENVGGGTTNPSPFAGAGWDVGSGQCNGDFTVSRDATFPGTPGGSGIELGMRIEQRSVGQLNPPDHTQRDYTVQTGSDPNRADRAWWNFQQSIAYSGSINSLDALTFIIRTDAGTSIPSQPFFDMLAARGTIDDRHPPKSTTTYTDIYQTSQNPVFGYFSAYDMDEEGAWTLTLVAMKSGRVSSVSICVHTPLAACEPLPVSFRDVRRSSDINAGVDLGGTAQLALNFTGSAAAAGDTWITVYDLDPNDSTPTTLGANAILLSADVLIHRPNNKKGAGLLALFNEAPPVTNKGLALFIFENGNSDTLVLATVDSTTGKLTTLATKALGAGILLNQWYHLRMEVVKSAGNFSVTGSVFRHATPTDPNSAIGTQVGTALTLGPTSLSGSGLADSGQVGIIASAISAIVDSSVTNFEIAID
jgi:hypothetical protein